MSDTRNILRATLLTFAALFAGMTAGDTDLWTKADLGTARGIAVAAFVGFALAVLAPWEHK